MTNENKLLGMVSQEGFLKNADFTRLYRRLTRKSDEIEPDCNVTQVYEVIMPWWERWEMRQRETNKMPEISAEN